MKFCLFKDQDGSAIDNSAWLTRKITYGNVKACFVCFKLGSVKF